MNPKGSVRILTSHAFGSSVLRLLASSVPLSPSHLVPSSLGAFGDVRSRGTETAESKVICFQVYDVPGPFLVQPFLLSSSGPSLAGLVPARRARVTRGTGPRVKRSGIVRIWQAFSCLLVQPCLMSYLTLYLGHILYLIYSHDCMYIDTLYPRLYTHISVTLCL